MKKPVAIALLAVFAVVCIALYASVHLTFKARTLDLDPDAKLRNLNRARLLYPLDAAAAQDAGTTYLSRAVDNLTDVARAKDDLTRAYQSLRSALRLDPGDAASHFYYAKTLSLMRYLGLPAEDNAFHEFQKAARLAGPRRDLAKEVGTTLLSQWPALSDEEKSFAEGLLQKALAGGDAGAFEEVLQLWDLGIRDYEVMDKIMPPSPVLLRRYAQFLADKSLSLAARHGALARAEGLEYEAAWKDYETGQNLTKYGRPGDSAERFKACLATLKMIKFYGFLSQPADIGASVEKKTALERTVSLELAKAMIEENRNLTEAEGPLRDYLALENNFEQVTDLESYLKDMRLLPETGAVQSIKNIPDLSFQVYLMFKLHKYRQIIALGAQLQRSLLVPDEEARKDLSEIFMLVADSYFKLDFVYESEAFYEKALELTPKNLDVLFRMQKYYERRNDTDKIKQVDRLLTDVLTAGDVLSQPRLLAKGSSFTQPLLLDMNLKRIRLEFQFGVLPGNPRPLVAVFLNDRVYWEDYLQEPGFSVTIDALPGLNDLSLIAVNGPVALKKLALMAAPETETKPGLDRTK